MVLNREELAATQLTVMGLCGKVLVAEGYRGGFCEKLQETSLMSDKSAGTKMDPPLANAKPISDSGSASVITNLRNGRKKMQEKQQGRERSETM